MAPQIAKEKVVHNLTEELIKPCALRMAKLVVGDEAAKKMKQIPLSNNVIRAKINEMSNVLNQIISDIKEANEKVGYICTDGAPAMIGHKSRFTTLMKEKVPHVSSSHCVLHQHALASKTLPVSLKEVLDSTVKTVNFIHARPLNHRIFKALCRKSVQITRRLAVAHRACSPSADSPLKLLDRVMSSVKFVLPTLNVRLWHRYKVLEPVLA
ncbi:protein FAM200C-like [Macrobrachium rosenbergii]|uniref:protein FAM200C-like n=1 Tax=Macrobrachium rosenbergii TaxID=79674 RepID=UPI0034D432A5